MLKISPVLISVMLWFSCWHNYCGCCGASWLFLLQTSASRTFCSFTLFVCMVGAQTAWHGKRTLQCGIVISVNTGRITSRYVERGTRLNRMWRSIAQAFTSHCKVLAVKYLLVHFLRTSVTVNLVCSETLLKVKLGTSYVVYDSFLAHSKNELMRWRVVCRLSVCLSVCL